MTRNRKAYRPNPEVLPPWQQGVLASWRISFMQHRYQGTTLCLHVHMCKDGDAIVEEGPDDKYLWNRLWHKATKIELEKLKSKTT